MNFATLLRTLPAALGLGFALSGGIAAADAVADARALLPQSYKDAGEIKVQATVLYAPHSFYKAGTTEFTGYEIDLFNAAAEILGVKPVYIETPFQQLVPGVKSRRADVSFGNLGENSLRREQVDFVNHTNLTFVLQIPEADKDKIKELYDLCGLHIGLVQGSAKVEEKALQPCESLGKPAAQFTEYPDTPTKEQAIRSGRMQAVDIVSVALARYREAAGQTKGTVLIPAPEVGNIYMGWIVDRGNDGLAQALAAALQIVWERGEYTEILKKYSITDMAIPAPGVNIGEAAKNWQVAAPK